MTILEATRTWLWDNCPLIDKSSPFNVNYLGTEATSYSVSTSGSTHTPDIAGHDLAKYDLLFKARMAYGDVLAANVAAADFFEGLAKWVRMQNAAHAYPAVSGYTVTGVTNTNAGLVLSAEANTAIYQLQIQITLEED